MGIFLYLQIEGEIKVAREALVEVTSKLRNYLYQEYLQKKMSTPPTSAASPVGSKTMSQETYARKNPPNAISRSGHNATTIKHTKVDRIKCAVFLNIINPAY